MITSIKHINLTVPVGTMEAAKSFYGGTLGFTSVPVPAATESRLAWFDITPGGQQIHVAYHKEGDQDGGKSSRHPCFGVEDKEALGKLRAKVWEHFERGGEAAPLEADKPGEADSGTKGPEFPTRFFARDYAGNRLEFSL